MSTLPLWQWRILHNDAVHAASLSHGETAVVAAIGSAWLALPRRAGRSVDLPDDGGELAAFGRSRLGGRRSAFILGRREVVAALRVDPRSVRRRQCVVRRVLLGVPVDAECGNLGEDFYLCGASRSKPVYEPTPRAGSAHLSPREISRSSDRNADRSRVINASVRDARTHGNVVWSACGLCRGRRGNRQSIDLASRRNRNDVSADLPRCGHRRARVGAKPETDCGGWRPMGATSRQGPFQE